MRLKYDGTDDTLPNLKYDGRCSTKTTKRNTKYRYTCICSWLYRTQVLDRRAAFALTETTRSLGNDSLTLVQYRTQDFEKGEGGQEL